jgi:tetratricopeptide (TPR) repeat protein
MVLSGTAWLAGDRQGAEVAYAEGKELAERLGDPEALARVALCLGRAARHAADYSAARGRLEEALAFERGRGDPLALAEQLLDLAPVTLALGDAVTARLLAQEALELARELGHRVVTAQALNELGEIARHQGDDAGATASYTESLNLLREMGNRSDIPRLLHNLGYIALHKGDVDEAAALFRQGLEGFSAGLLDRGIAEALSGLACVATVQGRPLDAARLWGLAEALREAGGGWGMWPPDQREHDRYLARARAAASPAAFAAAWQMGRGQTIAQALTTIPGAHASDAA